MSYSHGGFANSTSCIILVLLHASSSYAEANRNIGSVFTFTCALYVLLIKCLDYTTSIGERYINIIAYLNLVIPISLA